MNYQLNQENNLKEIYDSLVDNFKLCGASKRNEIVAEAKKMKKQLSKNKGVEVKEYNLVLDKIIKDYSKKKTTDELLDEMKYKKK